MLPKLMAREGNGNTQRNEGRCTHGFQTCHTVYHVPEGYLSTVDTIPFDRALSLHPSCTTEA